jgi:hypothetical protein
VLARVRESIRRRFLDLDERAARVREGSHDLGERFGDTEGSRLASRWVDLRAIPPRPEAERVRPWERLLRRAIGRSSQRLPALQHGGQGGAHAFGSQEHLRQRLKVGIAEPAVGDRLEAGRLLCANHDLERGIQALGSVVSANPVLKRRPGQGAEQRGEHDGIVRAEPATCVRQRQPRFRWIGPT